uniref:Fatty acid desaturase domain-containing protein n=1 Tax=Chromera velia CCMP2878 TaxID=1169474 RepID=A0A0G4GAH8_9ALVE|mmetsp:Transcript_6352/g.12617  ORF Transcript_6352/g.12617 Transcript_6352/m.12617 type:complete len:441 (+) Transcript_6352:232-1554(+)|eukprot:Cvel_21003.t1-p1 / transcript=Cvel_21003.t1 / gene=Cvel_21003 / organism=Chromera_velia_CCMP2878 / gene_product=Delta(12) fatty acid desaturase, putative / transcript_product=Delta(12) fatty acid desaturase, putative / location=Cvel_scaffold1935:2380-6196(-) / protein_length=440 / sequence_SO=supercontig / SO=protein_coding / is_pseudo=false
MATVGKKMATVDTSFKKKDADMCHSPTSSTSTKTDVADYEFAKSSLDSLKTMTDKVPGVNVPTPKEVHDAIPAHCKKRSAAISFAYLARDTVFLWAAVEVFRRLHPLLVGSSWLLAVPFWTLFAVVQGTIATGPWVLGHECGHGAFSESQDLNDVVGFVVHTLLLVPYFSWQYSHAKHHKFTNHLTWGETHVPATKKGASKLAKMASAIGDDAFVVYDAITHLLFGWPMYLLVNATGGRVDWKGNRLSKGAQKSHFVGNNNAIYPPDFRWKVDVSAAGVLLVVAGLAIWGAKCGWTEPLKWYIGPYLVVNFWLVLYTWLQHTHPDIPHYGEDSFTWLRGALSTVDRPYPWIVDQLHHHIGTTHVLHHVDFKVPCYHAQEATRALRAFLEPRGMYRYTDKSIFEGMVEAATHCHYVEDITGVQYLKGLTKMAQKQQAQKDQ